LRNSVDRVCEEVDSDILASFSYVVDVFRIA
jgi:hypothetical protein